MKVLVLGAGNIGKAVAWDLRDDFEVHIADISREKLAEVSEFAVPLELDASNFEKLVNVMKGFDLIVGTLPGNMGYNAARAAIEAGVDMVDVSFMPQNPLELRDQAENAGVTVIFDAGFAPGLSHVLMGRIWGEIDTLEAGRIYVGGLPKVPKSPLYYRITWSPRDLIEEYVRPARVIRGGELTSMDPLGETQKVTIGDFEFEAFPSDGLRSLLESVRAETLEEWTLRWPGHLERMRVLKELGFFKEENVDFTLKVITPLMTYESPDFSIMRVEGLGLLNGERTRMAYTVYDEERGGFTSMSRLTGFTAASVVRLVAEGSCIHDVIPPEILGMRIDTFRRIIQDLRDRGVEITEETGNAPSDTG
ncbi:saccharopine dehydrogenase family protein [Thermococcus sp. Bubb.Bath]|uniref:saccharopine dehydrogenase family protein n=1 Tax=Thermococcus sp. Bubb.Bath TaxID=1638242 RepID=UPI00143C1D0F|nr:saccharopine dehydrogenase family protein [Thermococcus sp. Bubb.Bath]NJF24756.1 saccharopine dehydrogenase family protein [Thermococcus sp. Bubb.Bath]